MKFLVYYNNGLGDTNILVIAKDKEEAENLFKLDCAEDEEFIKNHGFPTCTFLYVKEFRPLKDIVKDLVTHNKLSWDEIAYQTDHLGIKDLHKVRDDVVKGYDNLRNPNIDKGRLPDHLMDNLQQVTTVIDYQLHKQGEIFDPNNFLKKEI
jgi:hypothetical protein